MKKVISKLNLNKMTISNLSSSEMNHRIGGGGGKITKGNPCTTNLQGTDCGTYKTFTKAGSCTIVIK